jgi:hypothetical protein
VGVSKLSIIVSLPLLLASERQPLIFNRTRAENVALGMPIGKNTSGVASERQRLGRMLASLARDRRTRISHGGDLRTVVAYLHPLSF